MEQLPIKEISDKTSKSKLISLTDRILTLNKELSKEINYFQDKLISGYGAVKISKKIEKYYELNLDEFLLESKKTKIAINDDLIKDNLIDDFNLSSVKVKELICKIKNIEQKMNEIVYVIYELNSTEIKIIEENIMTINFLQ